MKVVATPPPLYHRTCAHADAKTIQKFASGVFHFRFQVHSSLGFVALSGWLPLLLREPPPRTLHVLGALLVSLFWRSYVHTDIRSKFCPKNYAYKHILHSAQPNFVKHIAYTRVRAYAQMSTFCQINLPRFFWCRDGAPFHTRSSERKVTRPKLQRIIIFLRT